MIKSEWCGSCRTNYKEKGYKGFYAPGNDGASAAMAQALYIGKYGKSIEKPSKTGG